MNRRICDYCGEPWPKNNIQLSRRPNDDQLTAELCDTCLDEITEYGNTKSINVKPPIVSRGENS